MSERDLKLFLDVLSGIVLVIVPLTFFACWYAWWFVWRYHKGGHVPVISVVLALTVSIATPCASYVGLLAWLRLSGTPVPLWTPPISALVFVLLDFIPLIVMG